MNKKIILFYLFAFFLFINILTYTAPYHPNILNDIGMKRSSFVIEEENNKKYGEIKKIEGKLKILVLLLKHKDYIENDIEKKEYFEKIFFGEEFGTLKNYIQEVSYGKADIEGEVGNWVIGEMDSTYYGENEKQEFMTYMISDVMKKSDNFFDYKEYDTSKDKYIDYLLIIHSGKAEEKTANRSDIRSGVWDINELYIDGIKVKKAAIISKDAPLGIIAHEFFHMLGLADIYINDQNQETFVGRYSLMDKGCWNGNQDKYDGSIPSHITAYEKSLLGWIELKEIDEKGIYTLKNINQNDEACILQIEKNRKEYIIIENRQKKGYDMEINGSGILMYRLYKEDINGESFEKSLINNTLNNNEPKRYFVMEANGARNIKYNNGDEFDFFSNQSFNKLSDIGWDKPNSCIWSENGYIENTGIVIKNISENDDEMSFEYLKNNLDINGDEEVNHNDIQYLKNNFNNYSYFYDYYGDGVIDFKDMKRFIERYEKEYEGVLLW